MNVLKNTTALALAMCLQYTDEGAVAVDATCGNGHDTLWLAQHFSKVYAFDVQQVAIDVTAARLQEHGCNNVELICASHVELPVYVQEAPKVILFNLGYLPGGDKGICTTTGETLTAVDKALQLLAVDGLLSVTMYQGHSEGYRERLNLLEWAAALDKSRYHCVRTDMLNQPALPPEILWITKKK